MGDSWEDSPPPPPPKPATLLQRGQPKTGGLNPNASSFSFSPGASSFVPGGHAQPQAPPPGFSMPTYPPPAGGSVISTPPPTPSRDAPGQTSGSTSPAGPAAPRQSSSAEATTSSPAKPIETPERVGNGSASGKTFRMLSSIIQLALQKVCVCQKLKGLHVPVVVRMFISFLPHYFSQPNTKLKLLRYLFSRQMQSSMQEHEHKGSTTPVAKLDPIQLLYVNGSQ